MSHRYSKLVYALPALAVWIVVSSRHPVRNRPKHNAEAIQMATTTSGFQMLDWRGEPMEGRVTETHIPWKGQPSLTSQSPRPSAMCVRLGRSSKDPWHVPRIEVCDTIDLGPNPHSVSGCRFHIGVGDRPLHRVVTLLASDDGRAFTQVAQYRANGKRLVFGLHRYWRLQYSFTGKRAAPSSHSFSYRVRMPAWGQG